MRLASVFICCVFFLAACIAIRPTERLDFVAPGTYPETAVFDSAANNFYVSGARTASVASVGRDGAYKVLYQDSLIRSTYGMKLHPDGGRLYICTGDANYSKYSTPQTRNKIGGLLVLNPQTGARISYTDLAALYKPPHFINDLVFDGTRNLYVTDSYANVIYKVAPDGQASVFSDHPLYKTMGIGLNGIVWHPAGFLLVASSAKGCLFKVSITNPSDVQKVKMDQFFLNADGLLLTGSDELVLIQNGGTDKIYKLITKDGWASAEMAATTLVADRFNYPSTATRVENDVWIMNARFHDLEDSTSIPSKIFSIQRAVFKPIPEKLRK